MNKYEDAKKWIDEIWTNSDWSRVDIVWSAVDQLRELIKKETPMKVHKKSPLKELSIGNAWFCPNCNNWLIIGYNNNYCSKCGQRLDWGKNGG